MNLSGMRVEEAREVNLKIMDLSTGKSRAWLSAMQNLMNIVTKFRLDLFMVPCGLMVLTCFNRHLHWASSNNIFRFINWFIVNRHYELSCEIKSIDNLISCTIFYFLNPFVLIPSPVQPLKSDESKEIKCKIQ